MSRLCASRLAFAPPSFDIVAGDRSRENYFQETAGFTADGSVRKADCGGKAHSGKGRQADQGNRGSHQAKARSHGRVGNRLLQDPSSGGAASSSQSLFLSCFSCLLDYSFFGCVRVCQRTCCCWQSGSSGFAGLRRGKEPLERAER
eukprot:24105-Amphidinium_carterae.1